MGTITILLLVVSICIAAGSAGLAVFFYLENTNLKEENKHLRIQLDAGRKMLLKEYEETAALKKALRDIEKEHEALED